MIKTCMSTGKYNIGHKTEMLDSKKIVEYISGASIAEFFNNYFNQRMNSILNGSETQKNTKLGIEVSISELATVHKIWTHGEEEWAQWLMNLPDSNGALNIFLNGPFISSEREAHITPVRYLRFIYIARPILAQKGWIEIDWYHASLPLSFDSSAQYDGLHVIGPPMKMAFHMVMHSLCNNL